jgi:hypothetical protein
MSLQNGNTSIGKILSQNCGFTCLSTLGTMPLYKVVSINIKLFKNSVATIIVISLSWFLSFHSSVCTFLRLPVPLSVHLFCLSICHSVCLSVLLSLCLTIRRVRVKQRTNLLLVSATEMDIWHAILT